MKYSQNVTNNILGVSPEPSKTYMGDITHFRMNKPYISHRENAKMRIHKLLESLKNIKNANGYMDIKFSDGKQMRININYK